ncbi:hypothetical protein [Gramella sp. MAR_2010_147]|uniref:hypothetical protein n=1 Tax=Gramella sp. MAR_2010_147 TaxID=1250205 RepID=UPI00087CA706|nr:hypothetical protein [Gramella sp. MAR_2010_147]SDR72787.1 hypothetical protein SAMN04488553_0460 [Gramella sp. MAR_2010_147]
MRRLLFGIFSLALLNSCDDGEIIVTSFDFEDSDVEFCEGPNKNVFYSINNNDVFESISLEFNSSVLDVGEDGNIIPPEEEEISFNLTGDGSNNNRIVYRIFNSEVPNDYFCNVVPPSQPAVIEEWISGTGAVVYITPGFADESPNIDVDGDGLDNIDEGWDPDGVDHLDTDEDGIPDYLDVDDDGDNVETDIELANSANDPVNSDGQRDTDEDGIPNYLDNDDDNDGILTRFEVQEGDENNPTLFQTAEGIPNYLNPEQVDELRHDVYILNDITRSYGYRITVEDLKFTKQDGSGESIQFASYNFGNYMESGIEVILCPDQDSNCGVTEETEEETEEPTT